MDQFVVQNKLDKPSYHLLQDQKILATIGHHAHIAQSDLAALKYLLARSDGAKI